MQNSKKPIDMTRKNVLTFSYELTIGKETKFQISVKFVFRMMFYNGFESDCLKKTEKSEEFQNEKRRRKS